MSSAELALTIIVAVKDAQDNLADFLASLPPESDSRVEYIFAVAGDPPAELVVPGRELGLTLAPATALVPHLWRDGIRRAKGVAVALTTAQCLPSPNWVSALLEADLANFVGVGGLIDLDPSCGAAHRAIFFLRYLAFAPPQLGRDVDDIAADNAIYRRAEVLEHRDLLATGFWEPSFHRRFAHLGLRLKLDPRISISYRGCEAPGAFAGHRYAHGQEYGGSRGRAEPLVRRLALILASPLLPVVLFARILQRVWAQPRFKSALPAALPWLLSFILAWSAGEARGYLGAMAARPLPTRHHA